jgi:hypothetical protein
MLARGTFEVATDKWEPCYAFCGHCCAVPVLARDGLSRISTGRPACGGHPARRRRRIERIPDGSCPEARAHEGVGCRTLGAARNETAENSVVEPPVELLESLNRDGFIPQDDIHDLTSIGILRAAALAKDEADVLIGGITI